MEGEQDSGLSQSKQATGRYLLRVLELPPEAVIHSFGNLFRSANNSFDINFKATIQKLVNFTIVIVVISVKTQSGKNKVFTVCLLVYCLFSSSKSICVRAKAVSLSFSA